MRRLSLVVPAAVLALACAGCGGSSKSSTTTGSGPSSRSSSSSAPARRNLAKAPPKQVVDAMAAALRTVRAYHVRGIEHAKDGTMLLAGDVSSSGSAQLNVQQGQRRVSVIVLGSTMYLRGNRAFWAAEAGSAGPHVAARLAGRWLRVPSSTGTLKQDLARLEPTNLAYCATRPTGPQTNLGERTLNGRPVVVLVDKGGPGDAPGKLFVAANGRPLPLRIVQTGPRPPGGMPDPRCTGRRSSTISSDERLSRYDEPLHIAPPPGATTPQAAAGGGGAPAA